MLFNHMNSCQMQSFLFSLSDILKEVKKTSAQAYLFRILLTSPSALSGWMTCLL